MNIKRIMALVLALVMVLSLVVMGFQVLAAEETTKPAPDVDLGENDDFIFDFGELVDAVGTQTNPIEITSPGDFGVDIKAGGEVYYAISPLLNGYYLTIIGTEDMTVTLNGVELDADEEGIFTAELTEPAEGNVQHMLVIGNPTETDVETTGNLNTAPGTQDNPVSISKIQDYKYVNVPANGSAYVLIAGNLSGYEAAVTGEGLTAVMGVAPFFTAMTADEYGTLRGVADGAPTVMMMITNTTAEAVEATVVVDGISVNWSWNEEQTVATASVAVPAGKTYYYGATIGGMNLSINGELYGMLNGSRWESEIFAIANSGETDEAYELSVTYPAGSMENPKALVIGPNSATVAEGNSQGYFFSWIAEEDGELTITMPEDNWMYQIMNMTTYVQGDMQWSDSDPVVNPATIEVAAGDELRIMVNTYDSATPWAAPAGTITFTASFEPAVKLQAKLAADTVSCDAEIILTMKMELPEELLNDADAYVKVVMNKKAGEVPTIYTMEQVKSVIEKDSNGRYCFKQGVASGEMTRYMTIEIYDGNGNLVNIEDYANGSVGTSVSRRVTDYIRRQLSSTSTAPVMAKLKPLLQAMAVYGGYAQQYFNVEANAPAYDLLSELGLEMPDLSTITADQIDAQATAEGADIGVTMIMDSSSVGLDSKIYHKVFFTLAEGANIEDYTFDIVKPLTTEKDVEVVYNESKNRYEVTIYDIPAAYLDYDYKIVVTKTETGEQYTGSMSVMAYVKRTIVKYANQEKLVNLLKAMYYYNQAANEYFGK